MLQGDIGHGCVRHPLSLPEGGPCLTREAGTDCAEGRSPVAGTGSGRVEQRPAWEAGEVSTRLSCVTFTGSQGALICCVSMRVFWDEICI